MTNWPITSLTRLAHLGFFYQMKWTSFARFAKYCEQTSASVCVCVWPYFHTTATTAMMKKRFFYNVEIFLFVPTGRVMRIALNRLCAYIFLQRRKKLKPTLAFQGSLSYYFLFFPSPPRNIMHLKLPQYEHDDECERNARDTQKPTFHCEI